ncbi:stage III sporulation protein AF [Oscillibacter sp.]|uniref:stage III sporulation protein AF n=1 Tax=Oscillibacter sp. TaxID=1945593 RepID=UPI001B7764B9|nr:stage III sporulation protein AF [Oscillibacter sp.]MBP3509711.1 stage III sporulation protein AF [Oscillibacter sp.]
MIGALREWLTSIVVVTLLLSVVQTLVPEGSIRRVASFVGGLILLAVLMRPVLGTDLERLQLDLGGYEQELKNAREELASSRETELTERIEERTAAYISDKADALGLKVAVRVEATTGPDGVSLPEKVELTGPYSRELADFMTRELGIPAERQVWHERKN